MSRTQCLALVSTMRQHNIHIYVVLPIQNRNSSYIIKNCRTGKNILKMLAFLITAGINELFILTFKINDNLLFFKWELLTLKSNVKKQRVNQVSTRAFDFPTLDMGV